ncbi:hypothetical protein BDV28DRAFT_137034 [Aspergillus coremiiformis]|uniref:Uncharacterized protein n=1 Tax=Aspergillus coremiiformis TaxID=138285 RepID=A0A5N6Z1Y1_9EURO|nr:hypothetical protein BDV28DRAFT_137034 [Aspergillus coremiiformis]
MSFQTTRPSSTLLIPSKRFLTTPKNPIRSTSTSISTPTPTSTSKPRSPDQPGEIKASQTTTVEYDFSQSPQPFLDPALWESIKAVDRERRDGGGEGDVYGKEREEGMRREKERNAEFGRMAVRGRMGRWR